MGTKVEFDNCFPGYYSMRECSHDLNGGSWAAYYGDNRFPNGQYYYGVLPRGITDSHPGYDKDCLKQKMLEHEAIFKNQVYELHRLYRVQKDLMDEFNGKEGYKLRAPYETSSSLSPMPSQKPPEDARKWIVPSFPLADSMSGRLHVPAADIVQSTVNMSKGKCIQVGPLPFGNCSSPKGSEASESRRTKFRRKMLDLELPADEYIDTDEVEQCVEANRPDVNHKSGCGNGVKLFLNHHGIVECNGNDMKSDPVQGKCNTLADLNEPILVEEPTTAFLSAEFSVTAGPHSGSCSTNFLGMPRDVSQNTQHGSIIGTSNNVLPADKGNGQVRFSYLLKTGHSKEELKPIHQSLQVVKLPASSHPPQFHLESTLLPPGFHQPNHSKGDLLTQTGSAFGTPERNYFHSGHTDLESTPSSFSQSDLAYSWDHSALSRGKSSGLDQKSMLVLPTSATLSKSSVQGSEFFWNKGLNSSLRANVEPGSEIPARNGFYHGSSSGSTEHAGRLPLGSITSSNCRNDDKTAPGSSEYLEVSAPHIGMKTNKDLNLTVLSNGLSTCHPFKIMDRAQKQHDHPPSLRWLTGEGPWSRDASSLRKVITSQESSLFESHSEPFSHNDLKKRFDCLNSLTPTSRNGLRHEVDDCRSGIMILDVPIFEKPLVSKHEVTAVPSAGPSGRPHSFGAEEIDMCVRKRGFDINMPYDPMGSEIGKTAADEALEKKVEICGASVRGLIDLNSCAIDEDVLPVSTNENRINIDLEAPVCLETEDGDLPGEDTPAKPHEAPIEQPQGRVEEATPVAELARVAAEAIVDISGSRHTAFPTLLPMEDSSENPLHWLAKVISSCRDDVSNSSGSSCSRTKHDGVEEDCLSSDSGYLESMTLKLRECDVEEFQCKPSVVLNVEGTGNNVSGSRSRRGKARRGRQRRDFQRDILPGLISLSRHEVTEDLQAFGGLMRATGHTWHSGPRRNATRNGCGRGRRRTVTAPSTPPATSTICSLLKQQLSNTSTSRVQLEDISLTGWGRISRRPRRQRFPTGNPATVTLT